MVVGSYKKLIKNNDRVSFLIDYIEGLEIKDEKRRHIYRLCRKRGFS